MKFTAGRYYGPTCVLGNGGEGWIANRDGSLGAGVLAVDTSLAVSQGLQFGIAPKCSAIPRTLTLEKLKPVDLKFLREDCPFLYLLKMLILTAA